MTIRKTIRSTVQPTVKSTIAGDGDGDGEPPVPTAPVLSQPSPITISEVDLPFEYSMSQHRVAGTLPFVWTLAAPISGITIDSSSGMLTVAAGTAVAVHDVGVIATNGQGSDQVNFDVTVELALTAPTLLPVDDIIIRQDELPSSPIDMSVYLDDPGTGTGLTYSLDDENPLVTIVGATGIMTIADGMPVAVDPTKLVVSNSVGSNEESFDIDVRDPYQINWTAPAETSQGTAISGPITYTVYWIGTGPELSETVSTTGFTIPDQNTPGQVWIYQVTSTAGGLESQRTPIATWTTPL